MTRSAPFALAVAAGAVTLLPLGCSDADGDGRDGSPSTPATAVIDPGDGGDYHPDIDPADFVAVIDNPYLPLVPGSHWVYEGREDGEVERVEVTVLDETRTVMGIEATVVRDTVTIDGELVEDTLDWFAQDREGNVWYLGESVENYEDGELVDREGSWEAGVDGALPGIVMLADPEVGDAYRQEHDRGEAEDLGEVIAVGESIEVRAGAFDDVIVTKDWNPFEPEVVEQKSYAPGVGLVFEEKVAGGTGTVELIEHSTG